MDITAYIVVHVCMSIYAMLDRHDMVAKFSDNDDVGIITNTLFIACCVIRHSFSYIMRKHHVGLNMSWEH